MVLLFIFVNVKNNKKNDKTRPYEKSTHFSIIEFSPQPGAHFSVPAYLGCRCRMYIGR